MATLKRQRGAVRAKFTKTLDELNEELVKEESDKKVLRQIFRRLEGHQAKLVSLDERIEATLLQDDTTEDKEFTDEYE
jgi:hypothetical protein